MKASDIMTRDVVTVGPDTTVRDAVRLLNEHHVTSLPVLNATGDVVGIVSELDLLRNRMPHDPRAHLWSHDADRAEPGRLVRDVMTDTVVCLSENADTADLAELLINNNVRAIPIISGADMVGIVSRRDVLRTLLRDDAAVLTDVGERLHAYSGEPERWRVEVDEGVVTVRGDFDDARQHDTVVALVRTVAGVNRVHAIGRRHAGRTLRVGTSSS
jgi:CBS domain-containing protein